MKRLLITLSLAACLLLPTVGLGRMAAPDNVPLDRLLRNLEFNLAKEPKNGEYLLLMARVHGLAFAKGAADTQVYWTDRTNQNGAFRFAPWVGTAISREGKLADRLTDIELNHLRQSFVNYGKAIDALEDSRLAKLGRAWIAEEASKHTKQTADFVTGRTMSKRDFLDLAAGYYRDLVAGYKSDKNAHRWTFPNDEPAYEAAEALLRMFKQDYPSKVGETEKLKRLVADYKERPVVMSPIIFPLDGTRGGDLITTNRTTSFDIAADGVSRQWPWISSSAAFLAWDPTGSGKITSGKQLFGNRTFDLFFSDGYAALASLDDNADGWLTNKELRGIAVWHDANSNGVSDRGEVRPVTAYGVEAIRVRSNGVTAGMTSASIGIRFSDGHTVPTYDWWPTSINSSKR